jgi:ribosomal protein S18 acetylase RimI-like enzyme
MGNFHIHKATHADISLIRDLALLIWPPTYSSILSKEQIDYMLDLLYSESSLVKQMQEGHEFILVYDEDERVGFASSSEVDPGIFKLHKIYVLPSQQGKGTGRFIIENLINQIKSAGASALKLNVNRHNNARSFYEKLGFAVIAEEDIDIGNGYFMNDYVMERRL